MNNRSLWAFAVLAVPMFASGCGVIAPQNSMEPISDDEIRQAYSATYNKRWMMDKTVILGTRNGVKLIAEYPCSDLCPDSTTRIIHYDIEPGPECTKIGGTSRMEAVPISVAVAVRPFCEPNITNRKNDLGN